MVLSLSFFASAIFSLIQFGYDVVNVPVDTPVTVRQIPPTFDPFAFASRLTSEFVELAPVALVAHLFARSRESMRRIGFDTTRPRFDLALGLALAIAAHLAATVATLIAQELDLPFRPLIGVNPDAHISAIVLLAAGSVAAGVSEETILTGYLITRLGDLGWTTQRAIVVSALLGGTFHLYQGLGGFIFNVVGGTIAGLIFRRTKRVMPLVVAHVLIDLIAYGVSLFLPDLAARLR